VKKITRLPLTVLAIGILSLALTSPAKANRPTATAGKITDVGGSFVCDCTNTEASCYCLS
jgi:hypothetical protein